MLWAFFLLLPVLGAVVVFGTALINGYPVPGGPRPRLGAPFAFAVFGVGLLLAGMLAGALTNLADLDLVETVFEEGAMIYVDLRRRAGGDGRRRLLDAEVVRLPAAVGTVVRPRRPRRTGDRPRRAAAADRRLRRPGGDGRHVRLQRPGRAVEHVVHGRPRADGAGRARVPRSRPRRRRRARRGGRRRPVGRPDAGVDDDVAGPGGQLRRPADGDVPRARPRPAGRPRRPRRARRDPRPARRPGPTAAPAGPRRDGARLRRLADADRRHARRLVPATGAGRGRRRAVAAREHHDPRGAGQRDALRARRPRAVRPVGRATRPVASSGPTPASRSGWSR